jgi:hypothetical protein
MPTEPAVTSLTSIATLRKFVKLQPQVERCELCSLQVPPDHAHLVELETRRLLCCCQACGILFSDGQNNRFRRVPKRVERLTGFRLSDEQWNRLQLPVDLAFFCYHTRVGRMVAQYPSPAGAMESLLDLPAWDDIVAENPLLVTFEPDVEALLVNRREGARDYWRAPLDECYRLVGIVRLHWQGFSGGTEVQAAIQQFFAGLQPRY